VEVLREHLQEWRSEDEHVALVPTMGNLHRGHACLIELAREHAERVVVSIFVNPTQFGEGEDFEDYPRTLERDTRRSKQSGADLLFTPDIDTMYPFGPDGATRIIVPGISEDLCGAHRPGHFDGVATVVSRFFTMVLPDVAVFGQKDYQQQLIIRRLVTDMNLQIKIVTGDTVRESDGLAMSSRNQYLSEEDRQKAPQLYALLQQTAAKLQEGERDYARLEAEALKALEHEGFKPDYFAIRRADDLKEPGATTMQLVVLVAAELGPARLIDNVLVSVRN
jgi:pantoate--beta-alanine ligase